MVRPLLYLGVRSVVTVILNHYYCDSHMVFIFPSSGVALFP